MAFSEIDMGTQDFDSPEYQTLIQHVVENNLTYSDLCQNQSFVQISLFRRGVENEKKSFGGYSYPHLAQLIDCS